MVISQPKPHQDRLAGMDLLQARRAAFRAAALCLTHIAALVVQDDVSKRRLPVCKMRIRLATALQTELGSAVPNRFARLQSQFGSEPGGSRVCKVSSVLSVPN